MAAKQSSPELSSLASQVLKGHQPTKAEINSLAASVLSQDEAPGQVATETTQPSGDQFLTALRAAIAPRTIARMTGKPEHMVIKLSDGKVLEVKRDTVRNTSNINAYVAELLA